MRNKKLLVIVEPTQSGLWAYIPNLPGCTSFGKDFKEIKSNLSEAIELHIEGMKEDGEEVPNVADLDKDLQYNFDLSTFFKEFPISITGFAERSGINGSLLRQYVTGKKHLSLRQADKIQNAIRVLGNEISNVNFI